MKILIVGSGGREHALAWKIRQSRLCKKLYCAPGNAGISEFAELVSIPGDNIEALRDFAVNTGVELVIAGPEAPLVAGLGDLLTKAGIRFFGPDAAAARLEGSKGFMKDLCAKYDIPTARYGRFHDSGNAREFIRATGAPIVIKADGLAAGKGVFVAATTEEAVSAAEEILDGGAFGEAGNEIVIEEFLEGEEVSFFALTDGQSVLPLTSAQDHKRAFDGDQGPNTGGMGAYSPARPEVWTRELEKKTLDRIINPTVKGMAEEGCPFKGVLYAGLMIVGNEPFLLEYNARFGDPECQPLMMRWQGDLVEVLKAASESRLRDVLHMVSWCERFAICVVMASKGYPGTYAKASRISGLKEAEQVPETRIFHAGTSLDSNGELINSGGRVLGITSTGGNLREARDRAYEATGKIKWPGGFYRKDIGWRALQKAPKP
jgi:phosphoribosylamine--glycine ligase